MKYLKTTIISIIIASGVVSTYLFFGSKTSALPLPEGESMSVVYSSSSDGKEGNEITKSVVGASPLKINLQDNTDGNRKEMFISPDRKLLAITLQPPQENGDILTYITDLNGNKLTSARLGSFLSWSPDSNNVLLFVSGIQDSEGRAAYSLTKNDQYYPLQIPKGAISASISPVDGHIAYSLTDQGTDRSDIWIKNNTGQEKILRKGKNETFAWLQWSPKGNKLAFMVYDMASLAPFNQTIWVMDEDGSNARKISNIVWNYPPVWSPDGTRLSFVVKEDNIPNPEQNNYNMLKSNLWEYNVTTASLNKLTSFSNKRVLHPGYSPDGTSTVFISNESGNDEIWLLKDNQLFQLTSDNHEKRYPILP